MFEALVQRLEPHGTLRRAWALQGGVSAQVTALEIERAEGQIFKRVVRQHGAADLRKNPRIAGDEFRLLQILYSADIPVPKPYDFDESGQILPTPYLVIEFIDGQTEFGPTHLQDALAQMAMTLAKIHRVDVTSLDVSFLSNQTKIWAEKLARRPNTLDESLSEGRIRAALQAAWPLPGHNPPALLHGDFWPGNLLWQEDRLAAVIDWEDAALGDPLSDLANSRLEILWAFGLEAMQAFTQGYQAAMPTLDFADLPYWDLCAALKPAHKLSDWGLSPARERIMRERHAVFVTQALSKLKLHTGE